MWYKQEFIDEPALERRKKVDKGEKSNDVPETEHRRPLERDLDRLLYCPAYRRLADKTQVYPLESHDSIRTRLTHSHEVRNVAFRLGQAAFKQEDSRDASALLSALGLAHDLGNPPFGHVGEKAIQSWFENNTKITEPFEDNDNLSNDFKKFDGNPQTIRIITRLQLRDGEYGLDLCSATIAGLLKYKRSGDKKVGYFLSEKHLVEKALKNINLEPNEKPLFAWIIEGCDDLIYSALDIEDVVVKGNASIYDVLAHVTHCFKNQTNYQDYINNVVKETQKKIDEATNDFSKTGSQHSLQDLNALGAQRFRTYAITYHFNNIKNELQTLLQSPRRPTSILDSETLTEKSNMESIYNCLKDFAFKTSYNSSEVLKAEADGHEAIQTVMDMIWFGISNRKDIKNIFSKRRHPVSRFIWNEISSSQRGAVEPTLDAIKALGFSETQALRYAECRLLTDMISGMTDTYLTIKAREWGKHLDVAKKEIS